MGKPSPRVLSIATQRFGMKYAFPDFSASLVKRDERIIWRGVFQPTPLSKAYDVQIDYTLGSRAKVTLPNEKWEKRPPHTFEDNGLCLYHREGIGAWRPGMAISQFLMPMIVHWLWCYEMWQVTGKWHGEEFAHDPAERKVAS